MMCEPTWPKEHNPKVGILDATGLYIQDRYHMSDFRMLKHISNDHDNKSFKMRTWPFLRPKMRLDGLEVQAEILEYGTQHWEPDTEE
jgi:hypothetical protein